MYKLVIAPLIAYLAKLRFPALFAITAVLFIVDFVIPDVIPFIDEIMLTPGHLEEAERAGVSRR